MTSSLTQARGGSVAEIACRGVDGGAVDEDIDALVAPQDRRRRVRDLLLVGDIERDRLAAARRLDLLFRGGERRLASSGDHHVGPRGGQLERAGEPDPRAAAGDPGDLALELTIAWHTALRRTGFPSVPWSFLRLGARL